MSTLSNPVLSNPVLSIVVPVYNEEQVLPVFHSRLSMVLDKMGLRSEIIYINDGSVDNSLSIMNGLHQSDQRVGIIDLSRNFGKETAMSAGLDHAVGDAVIIIDADLQDPPEMIPEFVEEWLNGYDMVYGQRLERNGESWMKRVTSYFFYRVIRRMSDVDIPADTGDFRLMSRRAVDALNRLREHNRFMKGMFAWIGFPKKALLYRRDPRHSGTTKWNYWNLWNFALEGITSFSDIPLRASSYIGVVIAVTAFIYGIVIITKTLLFGEPVRGYPSLMTVILFLGGVQLVALGIIGEYLGRMFMETKKRPLYIIKKHTPSII